MALHHQYDGHTDGFEIWCWWSLEFDTTGKYDRDYCVKTWNSFNSIPKNGQMPRTVASIIKMAKDAKELRVSREYKKLMDNFVYVIKGRKIVNVKSLENHDCYAEDADCSNDTLALDDLKTDKVGFNFIEIKGKKVKTVNIVDKWLRRHTIKKAVHTVYRPGERRIIKENCKDNVLNIFTFPRHIVTSKANLTPFFEHVQYLVPEPRENKRFLDWVAFNLQYPGEKCQSTILHISKKEGTGRGSFVEIMNCLLGPWNVREEFLHNIVGDSSASNFNDYMLNSLLCTIAESKDEEHSFGSTAERLKSLFTDPRHTINSKYGEKKKAESYTNFFIMSNHINALSLPDGDRRTSVFYLDAEPKDIEYYKKLEKWRQDKNNIASLFQELMQRDISEVDFSKPIDNEARRSLIQASKSQTEVYFDVVIKDPPASFVLYRQLVEYLHLIADEGFVLNKKQLERLLKNHGKHCHPVKINGTTLCPWALTNDIEISNDKIKENIIKFDDVIKRLGGCSRL